MFLCEVLFYHRRRRESSIRIFAAGYTGRIRFTVFAAIETVQDRETSRALISFFSHLEQFSTDWRSSSLPQK